MLASRRRYQKQSKLDSNKAHNEDIISIRMLKLRDNSICKPLVLFSNLALHKAFSHVNGKKQMSYQLIEKTTSSVLKTTDQSLFSQSVNKVLERIIYNTMFTYFTENNLISENQSGLNPGDSRINQLLAIAHKIFSSFDDNYEVRWVFLDI